MCEFGVPVAKNDGVSRLFRDDSGVLEVAALVVPRGAVGESEDLSCGLEGGDALREVVGGVVENVRNG